MWPCGQQGVVTWHLEARATETQCTQQQKRRYRHHGVGLLRFCYFLVIRGQASPRLVACWYARRVQGTAWATLPADRIGRKRQHGNAYFRRRRPLHETDSARSLVGSSIASPSGCASRVAEEAQPEQPASRLGLHAATEAAFGKTHSIDPRRTPKKSPRRAIRQAGCKI